MIKKVYKCSIYYKAIYGMMTSGILILGLFAMFYGIEKRDYNLPLLLIDLFFCTYAIVIFLRIFTYRVIMTDQFIKIYDFNKTICMYYQNIIDIKISGNVCYIIDKVSNEGSCFIRGSNAAGDYSTVRSISINASAVPSIKRAYLEGYDEIVETLLLKCGMESAGESTFRGIRKNTLNTAFSFLFLLKNREVKKIYIRDALEILVPYMLLMMMFLLSMLVFGTLAKGFYYSWMVISLKISFLLYITAAGYIFIIRFVPLVKKILHSESELKSIGIKNILLFMLFNTVVSAAVIAFFFYTIKNYS